MVQLDACLHPQAPRGSPHSISAAPRPAGERCGVPAARLLPAPWL